MSIISILKRTPLFQKVPDEALEQLASLSEVVLYSPDQMLIEQNEEGDALYLVVEGNVSIRRDGLQITQRGTGACIGEMALIDAAPRSASVVSVGHTKAVRIMRDEFWNIIESYPDVARHLLHLLSERIRQDTVRQVKATKERIQYEQDLKRAAEIQQNMLPSKDINEENFHALGVCIPAETVGGDYFDYIALQDGRVCCIIADGRGHGIDAALLVALIRSALHTQVRFDPSPKAVINALENVVKDAAKESTAFVTCFYALFEGNQLNYINAAHPYPLLCQQKDNIFELKTTNMALGWGHLDPNPYTVKTADWSPGDRLIMYSDAVVEAENPKEELFGFERLFNLVDKNLCFAPHQLRQKILKSLEEFRGEKPPADDLTLVIASHSE